MVIYMNQSEISSAVSYKRQPATIVQIIDIIQSSYVKQEGWDPNYINTPFGQKVYRVNIIGVVVEEPVVVPELNQFSCTIDDGTGKILVRSFEAVLNMNEIKLGQTVLIIGKPREYNNTFYILPEIIKPIAKEWTDSRVHELHLLEKMRAEMRSKVQKKKAAQQIQDTKSESTNTKYATEFSSANEFEGEDEEFGFDSDLDSNEQTENDIPQLIKLIDTLDSGDGVLVADLVEQISDAEEKVTKLLLHGEIYEIKPGRVKVLK